MTYLEDAELNSLYPFTLKNVQLEIFVLVKMNITGFTSWQIIGPFIP